jgi:hypothetical protein
MGFERVKLWGKMVFNEEAINDEWRFGLPEMCKAPFNIVIVMKEDFLYG